MKKKIAFIIYIVLVLVVLALGYYFISSNNNNVPKERSVLDEIPEWGYKLDSNATSLMRTEFAALRDILTADEVNNEEYAASVARLFIVDLFTLDNKLNQYDVGGEQYVLPSILDNYRLNVQNTIYRYLEDNTSGDRSQELPEVSEITITKQEEIEYEIEDDTYEAYVIELSWSFVTNMEYETSGEVILIKDDNYYYVVEKNRNS